MFNYTLDFTFFGYCNFIFMQFKGVLLQFHWDFIVLSDGSSKFQGTVSDNMWYAYFKAYFKECTRN